MHITSLALLILTWSSAVYSYTLMLDPYGDAQHTGRIIDNTFERGITLQCSEYLKREINQKFPDIRVIVSRVPGEIVEPLQNASFANKLQVNAYISFCFYQTEKIPTPVHIYYYEKSPADAWQKPEQLAWYSAENIYLAHLPATKNMVQIMHAIFGNNLYKSAFASHTPVGIPCIQLKGINAPSCIIEIGLQKKDDWKKIVPAFLQALEKVIRES
jgi:hypothetical protein